MAKSVSPKANDLSSLLHSSVRTKTGRQTAELPGGQNAIVEKKLNQFLQEQLSHVQENIVRSIPGKKEVIAGIFKKLEKADFRESAGIPLSEVIRAGVTEEERGKFTAEEWQQVNDSILMNATANEVEKILNLDLPLADNPIFRQDLESAKVVAYGRLTGLPESAVDRLVSTGVAMERIDEGYLDELVKENLITMKQKGDLLATSKMGLISGGNIELLEALRENKVQSPLDLVTWEQADWVKMITEKKIPLPPEEDSAESYARNIAETVESSFPTEVFLHKNITAFPQDDLKKITTTIEPLLRKNIRLFDGGRNEAIGVGEEDWEGINSGVKAAALAGIEALRPIANTYRYLGITDVIASDAGAEEKKAEINKRVSALADFYKNNPDIDIHSTKFSVDLSVKQNDTLNWKGIDPDKRPLIQRQMAAFQRAYILADNAETGGKLLKGGYDSAYRIIAQTEDEFIRHSGLGMEAGRKTYRKAIDLALGATHYYVSIRDSLKTAFNNIHVSNQHPVVNDLREIDGFDQLFGNQDFCDCEHCRSILGPAAYFCDLMYFVQEHISGKVFTGTKATHPLYLRRRRPDLWSLKLSCDNTSTEIPYLQVVNEVLEKYLQTESGVPDVYDFLKTTDSSVMQPFNLALEELRLYIRHFGQNLNDVYREMDMPLRDQHRERLTLSPEQLKIISVPDSGGVTKRFGNKPLANFNVQDFIRYAGISRTELDELLKSGFLPEIALVKVKTIKDNSDIQKSREELQLLTNTRLDLIHRYLRLWRKTPWAIREYDLLLHALRKKGLLGNLEDKNGGYENILQLAILLNFQERLNLTVEELATIIFELPQTAIVENQTAFASRIFNLNRINDAGITDKTPFILAGLGVTQGELQDLATLLAVDLTQTPTIAVLSNLFTQARVARGLKMTINDFLSAVRFVLNGQPVKSLDDIQKLIDFADWLNKTPLNIQDLIVILFGTENINNPYRNNTNSIWQKILEIQNREAVAVETDATRKLEMGRMLLRDYFLSTFNITGDQFDKEFLPNFISQSFDTAAAMALQSTFTSGAPDTLSDFDGLVAIAQKLERYTLLFSKHEFTPFQISFIVNHKNVFGVSDLKALTLNDLINISMYRSLILENELTIEKMQEALIIYQAQNSFTGSETALSELWKQPVSLVTSLLNNMTLTGPALNAIGFLGAGIKICSTLGIQGDSLKSLLGNNFQVASRIALGAFASKYVDENVRKEKLEPYTDKLNMLKRDALCDYIISREDKFKFHDLDDLYAFFLLDVEMSGCFRTSYIVAAITSLQMYVMRALTNLEQSDKNLNPNLADIKISPTWIPVDEWEWRKNYRVWEANRKVFLYPQNYIDPTLRDTKTHIFKELEDELLQQKITKESAEAAYKKYISQFAELTRMRIAGAYFHSVYDNYGYVNLDANTHSMYYLVSSVYFPLESDDSCFYLFARTNVLPYQYFYRTYNHNRKIWGNWTKIELGIEAKEISSLVHQGRLYIFWTEVKSKEVTSFEDGDSNSAGYIFNGFVKYSFLNENGKWNAPQRLTIGQGNEIEQKIYGRARNTTFFNSGRWEKEKDAIVETFQEKVFRKPYAYSSSDISAPVGLGFIWTNDKSSSTVTYTTQPVDFLINASVAKIKFTVPSRSFTVTNNDFSQAVASINISATIEVPNVFHHTVSAGATLQLFPGTCILFTEILSCEISGIVPFTINITGTSVRESDFRVSLSRNIVTNPSVQNIFEGSNLNYYSSQYDVAYTENGDMVSYVENGTRRLSKHKVAQNKDGQGGIHFFNGTYYEYIPADTILTDELADVLYAKGVEEFLSLKTQEITDNSGQQFDFNGPYGEYYWEIFFHIPFLIANHFNANQKFREAKWWYERIFNPTSEETPASTNPTDHNWQFREFRGLTAQKLKDNLTDVKAIEVYKKDPFDPHAIARLRISAYQKAIVTKYIDNLLDWGDRLFTQDTRESINEAEMLYRLGLGILGKRPVKMGKCETAAENTLTYAKVGPEIGNGAEFLITLENEYWTQKRDFEVSRQFIKGSKSLAAFGKKEMKEIDFKKLGEQASFRRIDDIARKVPPPMPGRVVITRDRQNQKMAMVKSYLDRIGNKKNKKDAIRKWDKARMTIDISAVSQGIKFEKIKRFPSYDLVRQSSMVFCIPENDELIKYWDRVEDRLFKIWNCMNIKGIRRSLSLFQPPIDPMMLVRLRAAGLSLEDIMAIILNVGKIPNYRFTYLVEKAKQYTQVVQGFGMGLLAALEKKNTEELLLLRTLHEKNILRLNKEIKKNEVIEAQHQAEAAAESLVNVQNRIDYYSGLLDTGLITWELVEQISKWTAGSIRGAEATMGFLASVFGFLPQIGSPFAMKYGGQELKSGTQSLADATGTLAAVADNVGILAGLEAGHQRREEEWRHQYTIAKQEYKQVSQLKLAAEVRQLIIEKQFDVHVKLMEQHDELDDFYKNKFTGLGLYNYLASGLNRVYRVSYNIAYDLAKLAERAYQFERFDNTFYIQSDNWEFDKAGLMAGDQLMQQLMELEKKYMDTNVRLPEITQSFSLAMLDASQLLQLRQTGTCTIKIPEIAFEVFYPGQYRRVIKSVRLTIPCVAGPFTNVSARLTLLKAEIEETENEALKEIDIAKNTSIFTSSGANDSGVFDLNFQDERYLPFEGAGAISEWKLELPALLRSFNYNSIPDVVMHLSYTAMDGDRNTAEAALAAGLTNHATTNGLYRLLSLKHDFPDSYTVLFSQSVQQTEFTLEKIHFPYILAGKNLTISEAKVYLRPKAEATVAVPATFYINGNNATVWSTADDIGVPGVSGDKNKIRGGSVALSGEAIRKWTLDAGTNGLDKNSLDDILILLKYRI